jgi:tetratricopeptide (TPR) repeat protein
MAELTTIQEGKTKLDFAKTIDSICFLHLKGHYKICYESKSWAIEVFENHNEYQWAAMTQRDVAKLCYDNTKNEELCVLYLKKCLKHLEKIEQWNSNHKMDSENRYAKKLLYQADVLGELGRFLKLYDPEKAEEIFHEAFDLINDLEYGHTHLKTYVEYAGFCTNRGWIDESIKILKSCLQKAEEDKQFRMTCNKLAKEETLMQIHYRLGEAYFQKRDFAYAEIHHKSLLQYEDAIYGLGGIQHHIELQATLIVVLMNQFKLKEAKKLTNKLQKQVKAYERKNARSGSERIKDKNIINFFGKPLIFEKTRGKNFWLETVMPTLNAVMFPEKTIPKTPKYVKKMSKRIGKEKFCANCGDKRPLQELKACINCQKVYYCGKKCQKEHWKIEHKKNCGRKGKAMFAYGIIQLGSSVVSAVALAAIALSLCSMKKEATIFNECVEEIQSSGKSSSSAVRFCNGGK